MLSKNLLLLQIQRLLYSLRLLPERRGLIMQGWIHIRRSVILWL
nr:MAG TPA: hypothetical protein [Caudoviricetes sp.]